MIDGVIVKPLRQIVDERGKVMHMMRNDDPEFNIFGEIYFSEVNPGAIKAWHLHHKMVLNYAVPKGLIKFVLYDSRPKSSTFGQLQELFLGADNYCLVIVPSLIWSGFQGLGDEPSLVANCSSIPYDASEILRKDPFDQSIPYNWSPRDP